MIWRRSKQAGAVATQAAEDEFSGTTEELLAEIERLTEANRSAVDRGNASRLLRLRHLLAARLLDQASGAPEHPPPDFAALPEADGLPAISPQELTPELVRAGILRDGSLLVRGLIEREGALSFAAAIERSFEERERHDNGGAADPAYYEEFEPDPRFTAPVSRPWIKEGGGVLAVDAPKLSFEMLDMFERAGILRLAAAYLGEPAAISVQKTTLRKVDPWINGAWHQDGAFMGDVRALNVWVALSRCGDQSPGLDIVPRRLEHFVAAGTEGTFLSYQVSQQIAEEAAGDRPIVRPIFEPGDVLFFDDLCLHQTGSDPAMPNPRYAVESWFFGVSAFPDEYAPIAV